ncbi:hypothetical protein BJV78DRAFT_955597 [Lactifluus subvellereus]|nr:hypothetical protein BJV78DRAFT_955597 [Lactifluus subvellereus]
MMIVSHPRATTVQGRKSSAYEGFPSYDLSRSTQYLFNGGIWSRPSTKPDLAEGKSGTITFDGGHENDEMAEHWEKGAKEIVIFTGLFSTADTSAFYLENIHKLQVLADPNINSSIHTFHSSSLLSEIHHRGELWFLSLVTSLTCAMLAILLRQWAR